MASSQVHRLDLDIIKEPDDLWAKFFFAWLKYLGEENAMARDRLGALEEAVTQLDSAVAKMQPDQRSDDLVKAMSVLQEFRDASKQQSTRGLDSVETLATIAQQIVAQQKSG